jgi:hypothetical protein
MHDLILGAQPAAAAPIPLALAENLDQCKMQAL